MIKIRSVCLALAAGALAVFAGCSSNEQEYPQPAASQGDEATPPESNTSTMPSSTSTNTAGISAAPTTASTGMDAESLRDSQIMEVLKSVDQAEIEQATLAVNRAKDPRVKTFAERMIDQHSRSLKEGAAFMHTANIAPEDSTLAGQLQTKTGQTLQTMRGIDNSMFDSTYMAAQVKQHQEVLDLLDKRMIPSADNADLKASLKDTRAMVSNHLTEAQSVLSNLQR